MADKKRQTRRSNPKSPKIYNHNSHHKTANPQLFAFTRRRIVFSVSVLMFLFVVVLLSVFSNTWRFVAPDDVPTTSSLYTIEVVNEFPHDPYAFTQGLLYAGNDSLFESTGLNGRSSVRKVALQSGKVQVLHKMEYSYFGEGLTLLGERLLQVTWLDKTGFIYNRQTLNKVGEFTHQMEDGWGLATDGRNLFGTDGTSTLYQIDPQTFKVVGKQTVKFKGDEVHNLNELEYVNGEVWANVWQSDCIARISHKDGNIVGWILLQNLREGLIAAGNNEIDVLNGIAWDADEKRLFVTGKLWPKLYEIKLLPVKKQFDDGAIKRLCLRRPVNFSKP